MRHLPVDLVRRGKYQPRVDMHPESLEDLANSIKAQGVVQPIVVKPTGTGSYEIIAGERRWRAAQLAGLQEIPAVVRDVSDQAAMAMALIENIQRENLNPMEEANALQRLIKEFQLTHQEVAEAVGRSRAAVSNLLRLLELNDDVKRLLEQRRLEMGHARALLALKDAAQSAAARTVAEKGLSVRETEALVKRWVQNLPEEKPAATRPGSGCPPPPGRIVGKAGSGGAVSAHGQGQRQTHHQLQQPGRAGRHPGAYQISRWDISIKVPPIARPFPGPPNEARRHGHPSPAYR